MGTRPSSFDSLRSALRKAADKEKAALLQGFFKTGAGEYGEGDRFLGVVVPDIRRIAAGHMDAPLAQVCRLLRSPWHEERLLAVVMLVMRFQGSAPSGRRAIYRAYLAHSAHINNWDLVDLSAPHIVGGYLEDKGRAPLYRLAGSPSLWERRIAILATFSFIRNNDFQDAFAIIDRLLADREDLIHKAAGWMLREIGKRSMEAEESFLRKRYRRMPRTMLRYAIERFPEARRQQYLRGEA